MKLGICGLDCGNAKPLLPPRKTMAKIGCLSKVEPTIYHCKECNIRKCGFDKEVNNCGDCRDYPCETIAKFHQSVPEAKKNLQER